MGKNILVFGSNLAGRHGAGSAKYARMEHGAIYGQGEGLQGNSYAIPTKSKTFAVLPINVIEEKVNVFIQHAKENPDVQFNVTRIGCGLAGYGDLDIGPLFTKAPENCILPPMWELLFKG
jgi:hypothetical protein